jgi:hypothetical protein
MDDMRKMSWMMPCEARRMSAMSTQRLLLGLLLVAGGAGCRTAGAPASPDAANAPQLAGGWRSDCLPSPQADGSKQSIRLDFQLTAARWDLDYVTHGDDACAAPLVTVHIAGPYTLERPSAQVDGAWEARFGFDAKTIRPEVDGLRDHLNSLEGCGGADFQTGVAQDVYAAGCPAFGQYPRSSCAADFDLVKLDGDALHFGARPADNNMCSPERRPTALSQVANRRS